MTDRTAAAIAAAVAAGELSAEAVCAEALDAIADGDAYNAFVCVRDREAALAEARAVDQARAAGAEPGVLAGVPIALKDNLVTRGMPTTAASRILDGFASPYDATVVERLRDAGAIVVGKTNLDEFAMGSTNAHSAHGPTKNPHDLERSPGGSSGGSAAAVAAGLCPVALGSDTGGSIRQPASHCGVVGIKPTYGRVSRWGLIAHASSLDQIGPIGRTVADCALVLEAIAGLDARDATSVDADVPRFRDALDQGIAGLRVGVPREYFEAEVAVDEAVTTAVRAAIDRLANAGAEVVDVSLPHTAHAVATYYLIATAEASSNLARYDGVRYGQRAEAATLDTMYEETRSAGFGDEVKRRIMLGTFVLSAGYYDQYYRRAQQARTLIRRDFEQAFAEVDVLCGPVAPTAAPRIGQAADDPLSVYLADVYTTACNLAGLPGMSVPCGQTDAGLPVGLQLLAPPLQEARLFRAGAAVERLRAGH